MAKLSGFNPIITTASAHNADYCKDAGATHVIDYKETPYGPAFIAAVKAITSAPVKVIYNATPLDETSQIACWNALAPGGKLIVAMPTPSKEIGKPGEEDKDGRRVVTVLGSVHNDEAGGDTNIGKSLFAVLEKLLKDGEIRPSRVEVLPGGLNGIQGGLEKLWARQVSGVKLVARIGDTPQ